MVWIGWMVNNENVYGKLGVSKSEGIFCRITEVVKCSTRRLFGHLENMEGDKLPYNVQEWSESCGYKRKTPVKGRTECWNIWGREGIGECINRSKWRLLSRLLPWGSCQEKTSEIRLFLYNTFLNLVFAVKPYFIPRQLDDHQQICECFYQCIKCKYDNFIFMIKCC